MDFLCVGWCSSSCWTWLLFSLLTLCSCILLQMVLLPSSVVCFFGWLCHWGARGWFCLFGGKYRVHSCSIKDHRGLPAAQAGQLWSEAGADGMPKFQQWLGWVPRSSPARASWSWHCSGWTLYFLLVASTSKRSTTLLSCGALGTSIVGFTP